VLLDVFEFASNVLHTTPPTSAEETEASKSCLNNSSLLSDVLGMIEAAVDRLSFFLEKEDPHSDVTLAFMAKNKLQSFLEKILECAVRNESGHPLLYHFTESARKKLTALKKKDEVAFPMEVDLAQVPPSDATSSGFLDARDQEGTCVLPAPKHSRPDSTKANENMAKDEIPHLPTSIIPHDETDNAKISAAVKELICKTLEALKDAAIPQVVGITDHLKAANELLEEKMTTS